MSKETKNNKEKEVINGMSKFALLILVGDMIANPLLERPSGNKYESKYKSLVWRSPKGLELSWEKAKDLTVGAELVNGEHMTIVLEDRWQGHSKVVLGKKGIKIVGWERNSKGSIRPVIRVGSDTRGKRHTLRYGNGFEITVYVK